MTSRLKKQMALFAAVIIVVFMAILLYFQFPKKLYKAAFIERTTSIVPISEVVSVMREQEDVTPPKGEHITATEVNTKKQESKNNDDAVDKGMSPERYSRAIKLHSPEYMSVYRGLAIELERGALDLEKGAYEYGFPIPVYPYRENIEEVYALLESRGYDRDNLYFFYEDYNKKINEDGLEKSKKVQQIIALAREIEPSLFISEVEKLFEDQSNIGLALLKYEAYYARGMINEFFNEITTIIIVLDNFDSNYVDERAILYFLLQLASVIAYQPDIPEGETTLQLPQRVSISHPQFLVGLELDGKL